MGKGTMWLVFVLLAVEVTWLGLASRVVVTPPAASQQPVQAEVTQTKDAVTFLLANHHPDLMPTIEVTVRKPLDQPLHYTKPSPTSTLVTLPTGDLSRNPAQVLEYTWSVGVREVTGRYLYINPLFLYDWKVREHELFTIYYVGSFPAAQAGLWEEIYRWLGDFLLVRPTRQVLYLFPGASDLRKALGQSTADGPPLAGLWVEGSQSIFLAPQSNAARSSTLAHELTHALLYRGNPIWWEEGIATWVTYKEAARRPGARPQAAWSAEALKALRQLALERDLSLSDGGHAGTYPLDRYTIGSSFILYIRSRLGEPGVLLLASSAAAKPLKEAVPEVLGETLEEAERRWLAYIRSSRFPEDAAAP